MDIFANSSTDLCGIRLALPNLDKVNMVLDLIEGNFIVDKENSENKLERLKTDEFGYSFIHIIVQLDPNSKLYEDLEIPDELYDLKAKIQLCTFLQYGWAANQRDKIYKSEFSVINKSSDTI